MVKINNLKSPNLIISILQISNQKIFQLIQIQNSVEQIITKKAYWWDRLQVIKIEEAACFRIIWIKFPNNGNNKWHKWLKWDLAWVKWIILLHHILKIITINNNSKDNSKWWINLLIIAIIIVNKWGTLININNNNNKKKCLNFLIQLLTIEGNQILLLNNIINECSSILSINQDFQVSLDHLVFLKCFQIWSVPNMDFMIVWNREKVIKIIQMIKLIYHLS